MIRFRLTIGKGSAALKIESDMPPMLARPRREESARDALVVETIQAFHDDRGTGAITRHPATGDPKKPKCGVCGIRPARPMNVADAVFVRERFADAGMQSAAAYAFVLTRVLLTVRNQERLCECDRTAWLRAWRSFRGAASWARLGLP